MTGGAWVGVDLLQVLDAVAGEGGHTGLVTFAALQRARSSVAVAMASPDYAGYRFPSDVIQRAVWMYLRFTLSYRDVEDLLTERGIEVSYETIRGWVSREHPARGSEGRGRR